MSKEQYVTFEVARLLKEKGFDWFTYSYYTKDDVDKEPYFGMENLCPDNWNGEVDEVNDLWFSAPTQQMACRWLREEKDIDIIPFHERLPHGCYWCRIEHNLLTAHQQSPIYSTYEDAVEAALQYCLTNLI